METKKGKTVKPNKIIYSVFYFILMPVMYFVYGLRIKRNIKDIKGPFIAIANHESKADFIIAGLALYPHHMIFVAAMQYFCMTPINSVLKIMRAIPKCLFQADVSTVRGMINAINDGQKVIIFPEGRTSSDGSYEGCKESINKFIKKMNVPVVNVHINGSYFFAPFWRNSIARGKINVDVNVLLTPEQISKLSVEEISIVVKEGLFYDEYNYQKNQKIKYKGRNLSHGLENILYLCPECGAEFSLKTHKHIVSCNCCTMSATFTALGNFTGGKFHSIEDWYTFQKEYEVKKFEAKGYSLSHEVLLFMPNEQKNNIVHVGKGVITLSKDGHSYIGTKNGENITLFFSTKNVPALPYDPGDNFQIYSSGYLYKFKPTNRKFCSKYAIAGETLYNKLYMN